MKRRQIKEVGGKTLIVLGDNKKLKGVGWYLDWDWSKMKMATEAMNTTCGRMEERLCMGAAAKKFNTQQLQQLRGY